MMGVIAILASTSEAGEDYAQELGLMNEYKVITDYEDLEDIEIKAFVITPGYVEEYMTKTDFDWALYSTVYELSNEHNAPPG